ncbi:hypothetical protein [Roseibium sp.]|uniref:hypothetical protein n=1 Tax=Roseibium sp. TaxID=1936156 RepID=UPI0025E4126F|nr:hypothetical protein [Roseibium sp.]
MINRNSLSSVLAGGLSAVLLLSVSALAQDKIDPVLAEAVTEGQPERYSLVAIDGDVLRVDRQNGTVSVCQEQNDAWRCSPVPLAEDAYLAEINELAEEVDRLTARLEQLESEEGSGPSSDEPDMEKVEPEQGDKPDEDRTVLSQEDEEELEKVLTFTESAMRRFFGMVRDLQKDFEEDGSNN